MSRGAQVAPAHVRPPVMAGGGVALPVAGLGVVAQRPQPGDGTAVDARGREARPQIGGVLPASGGDVPADEQVAVEDHAGTTARWTLSIASAIASTGSSVAFSFQGP